MLHAFGSQDPLFSLLFGIATTTIAGLIKSPLIFLGLPVTVGGRGAIVVKFGLWFYDFITRRQRQTPRHFFMSKAKSAKEIPGLRANIACTANYWDAWISQAERLCVEMIREGIMDNPDCAAINYVTAAKTSSDEIVLQDALTGEEFRAVAGRRTFRFELGGRGYFAKRPVQQHLYQLMRIRLGNPGIAVHLFVMTYVTS